MCYMLLYLNYMYAIGIKFDKRFVADVVDLFVLGVEVRDLDQGISDHDMVVLIASHEGTENNFTGQLSFVRDDRRFLGHRDVSRACRHHCDQRPFGLRAVHRDDEGPRFPQLAYRGGTEGSRSGLHDRRLSQPGSTCRVPAE